MRSALTSVLIVPLWNWNSSGVRSLQTRQIVLIVPLWNWNTVTSPSAAFSCSVLIVPLWNWNHLRQSTAQFLFRFNRTFMELKFDKATRLLAHNEVLIVPLWNWNSEIREEEKKEKDVLIVPLWNWNYNENRRMTYHQYRFNRTFMELK